MSEHALRAGIEGLIAKCRARADSSAEEAQRIRRTTGYRSDAEERCYTRAEAWQQTVDTLAALMKALPAQEPHYDDCHCGQSPEGEDQFGLGCIVPEHRAKALKRWQHDAWVQQEVILELTKQLRGRAVPAQEPEPRQCRYCGGVWADCDCMHPDEEGNSRLGADHEASVGRAVPAQEPEPEPFIDRLALLRDMLWNKTRSPQTENETVRAQVAGKLNDIINESRRAVPPAAQPIVEAVESCIHALVRAGHPALAWPFHNAIRDAIIAATKPVTPPAASTDRLVWLRTQLEQKIHEAKNAILQCRAEGDDGGDDFHDGRVSAYSGCLAMVEAPVTPPAGDGWQPIEGYDKAKHPFAVLVVTREGVGEARQHDDGAYGSWFWVNIHEKGPIFPTHWMPLPAPPVAAREAEKT